MRVLSKRFDILVVNFKSGPAHIITTELVEGLDLTEFKTKVANALDMKGCWKEHPDLVY